jgi:hypothetical protein
MGQSAIPCKLARRQTGLDVDPLSDTLFEFAIELRLCEKSTSEL